MQLTFGLIADTAALYGGPNPKCCLLGATDTLVADEFPCRRTFCVLCWLNLEPSELEQPHRLVLSWRDPDGRALAEATADFSIQPRRGERVEQIRHRTPAAQLFDFREMLVPTPGEYRFDVAVDGKAIGGFRIQAVRGVEQRALEGV